MPAHLVAPQTVATPSAVEEGEPPSRKAAKRGELARENKAGRVVTARRAARASERESRQDAKTQKKSCPENMAGCVATARAETGVQVAL